MNWSPPPGWYPDHEAPEGHIRYWDGSGWTEDRSAEPPARARSLGGVRRWADRVAAAIVVVAVVVALAIVFDNQAPAHEDGSRAGKAGHPRPSTAPAAASESATTADLTPTPSPTLPGSDSTPLTEGQRTYAVTSILDGRTVRLDNGARVRLVGISVPGAGECGSGRTVRLLTRLVRGQNVALYRPGADKDAGGRLLRYVVIGRTDVGLRMVRNGRAVAMGTRAGLEPHPRQAAYARAETKAPPRLAAQCR